MSNIMISKILEIGSVSWKWKLQLWMFRYIL